MFYVVVDKITKDLVYNNQYIIYQLWFAIAGFLFKGVI